MQCQCPEYSIFLLNPTERLIFFTLIVSKVTPQVMNTIKQYECDPTNIIIISLAQFQITLLQTWCYYQTWAICTVLQVKMCSSQGPSLSKQPDLFWSAVEEICHTEICFCLFCSFLWWESECCLLLWWNRVRGLPALDSSADWNVKKDTRIEVPGNRHKHVDTMTLMFSSNWILIGSLVW